MIQKQLAEGYGFTEAITESVPNTKSILEPIIVNVLSIGTDRTGSLLSGSY